MLKAYADLKELLVLIKDNKFWLVNPEIAKKKLIC